MWELVSGSALEIVTYLKDGYEPFAVSTNRMGFDTIWFKSCFSYVSNILKNSNWFNYSSRDRGCRNGSSSRD